MSSSIDRIATLLEDCEDGRVAPMYDTSEDTYREQRGSLFGESLPVRTVPVKYNADKQEIFVVSDLHIGSGRNYAGVYPGTENFFADDGFERFLGNANIIKKTNNAILIINGDIFDFVRITGHPGRIRQVRLARRIRHLLRGRILRNPGSPSPKGVADEYDEWVRELAKVGIHKSRQQLEGCISKKERKYGLGTEDFKTIYKLIKIRRGHPRFFVALGQWLKQGNKLIIVKGNHDLELYWKYVRNYLRLVLAEEIVAKGRSSNIEAILKNTVLPHIAFIDDSVEIDGDFYVEHGHRYDKFTMVLEGPALKSEPDKINLPFGSFFNRYVINRVELFYPFLDNVRPSGNVLPVLIKENFPLAIRVFLQHIPALIGVLGKNWRYVWFMIRKPFWVVLAALLPVVIAVCMNRNSIMILVSRIQDPSGFAGVLVDQAKSVGVLLLSYLLSRVVAWVQLTEPSSLDTYAKERFKGTTYRLMAMGHTHNPGEYVFEGQRRFYNTGTWIPVIETSSADVREDKTYTFLHLVRDDSGKLQPANEGLLERWNDNAGRAEPLVLVQRK